MTNSQGIEGLPPGVKVVRVGRPPCKGDRAIGCDGSMFTAVHGGYGDAMPILAPDNAYGKWLDEVPVPEGWELDGTIEEAYREPLSGEAFIVRAGGTISGIDASFTACERVGSIIIDDRRRLIIRRKLSPLDALLEEAASAIDSRYSQISIHPEARKARDLAARLRAAKGGAK